MARVRDVKCSIVTSAEGVEVHCSGYQGWWNPKPFTTTTGFFWKDVTQAIAFKRDCWSVDLICLVFELNEKLVIEVNEEMQGWEELVEEMTAHLPGALAFSEWWNKVAFPAFKLCLTHVYPPADHPLQHASSTVSVL